MSFNLHQRSLLKLLDFTPREIRYLLDLAHELKRAKAAGTEVPRLKGKNIALIFEKASTRTRVGFEVAAYDQGAHVTYLGPSGTQIGHKENLTPRPNGLATDLQPLSGSPSQMLWKSQEREEDELRR